MNESNAKIYYGAVDSINVLKITGSLRFNQCATLEYFLQEILKSNAPKNLLIDLSQTQLLDSTALGLLAKIALQFKKSQNKQPDLYCPANDLKKILLSMSFESLFHFTTNKMEVADLPEISIKADTEQAQTQRVLEAHQTLMGLSDKNKKEFKSVVEMIQESLLKK